MSGDRAAPDTGEAGFALVTALVAAMLFAFFAYTVLASDQGAISGFEGQLERARLEAAADAGLATVVARLGASSGARWPLDGHSEALTIGDDDITASVEDERGKVAVNTINPDQARRLFAGTGLSGAQLDQAADSLMNWLNGGARANGAKVLDYAGDGVRMRGGPIRTLGELAAIHGVTPDVLNRITPALTLFFGDGGAFDHSTASPLALKAMSENGENAPEAIIRAREQAGERTALDAGPDINYVGRPFTVRITVHDQRGGMFHRNFIVELTGRASRPYWVRAID